MIEKNVQLTRSDVVGNEVVSENINPKTDTSSVQDVTNNLPLSETQRVMWNAINSKLARIVNSVNGKTGVLWLSKEDVGLGNVDNLSFDGILERLESLMIDTFGKKRMRLFNNLNEVDQFCDRQTKEKDYVVSESPFFSINGYNLDQKSYIGYICLNQTDPIHLKLEHTQLPIQLSGWSDMSMRWDDEWGVRIKCNKCDTIMDWNEKPLTEPTTCHNCNAVGDDLELITNESHSGRLGVNIAKQERYLEVYQPAYTPGTSLNEIDKSKGGLRIRPGSLYGRFHYFSGVYGMDVTGSQTDSPLLLRNTNTTDGAPIVIRIQDLDENDSGMIPTEIHARLHPDWMWRDPYDSNSPYDTPMDYPSHFEQENPDRIGGLREGDKLFISFRDYRAGNPPTVPVDMDARLLFRNDHIGVVTSTPSTWDPTAPYIITLHRIRVKVGWGLKHLNDRSEPKDSFITLQLAKGNVGGNIPDDIVTNLSGLQVTKGRYDPDIAEFDMASEIDERFRITNLPTGPHMAFAGTNKNRTGGLYINPDSSLAIIPHRHYRGGTDIDSVVSNWEAVIPGDPRHDNGTQTSRHALEENSYVGINITKITHRVSETTRWNVGNSSGLRVICAGDTLDMQTFYGVRSSDNHLDLNFTTPHSGGISVNVGNFLEISPPNYDKSAEDFNTGGKVNIRINPEKGLEAIDTCIDNKMAVKINTKRAMHFRKDGTPNKINEGIVTSGQQGQLELNIGDINQDTMYDKRRGLEFWNDGTDMGRLRINIGTNEDAPDYRQRRGLTFSVSSANKEDETKTVPGQERLKLWLHPRNGLSFRGVTREHEYDEETNVIDAETTGQLELNYQHLLENLSNHTGRGIIIRDHRSITGNPRDFRIETRLVGQDQTTGNPVQKSFGLEYGNNTSNPSDITTNNCGIRARAWNGILINNEEATTNDPDPYTKAHHGIAIRIDPDSALRFKDTLDTSGGGSSITNGKRAIMINIGQHRGTSDETRRRQGLTFETGTPIVPRHNTGTSSGWGSDVSSKLRIWENTFRGIEFRKRPNSNEYDTSPYLNSLGAKIDKNGMIFSMSEVTGNGVLATWNKTKLDTDGRLIKVNPAMDSNEESITGMLQVKIHGGLSFRFRGDTWTTTNNPYQTTIISDHNPNGLARTPQRQDFQHGRIEAQVNRARGLEIATVETESSAITSNNIYPTNGTTIGDLQLRINEKTALRFTGDNILNYPDENNFGDVQLAAMEIEEFETPSVVLESYVKEIPPAVINIPAFSVSNLNKPDDITITPSLPSDGLIVSFTAYQMTVGGNKLHIPKRGVHFGKTKVQVPVRNMVIRRNTARLDSNTITVNTRTLTVEQPTPNMEWNLQPTTPIVIPPLTTAFTSPTVISSKTFTTDSKEIPHTQFTEDNRIIVLPETYRQSESLVIRTNNVTIPSYQTKISWAAIGSDHKTYTITKTVIVEERTLSLDDEPIVAHTILDLYHDGTTHVRIPESDRFLRDQGKLRLIIDPNQGLGFNAVTSGTISTGNSKNPHDWTLDVDRRDVNALRIKLNKERGIKFRTDGSKPRNTYHLMNNADDNMNGSGTNGQVELHILGQNSGNPATLNLTATDGGLKFDNRTGSTNGSLFIDETWVTKNLKLSRGIMLTTTETGLTSGSIQIRRGIGLSFTTINSNTSPLQLGLPTSIVVENATTETGHTTNINNVWGETHSHKLNPDKTEKVWAYEVGEKSRKLPSLLTTDKDSKVKWQSLENILKPIIDTFSFGSGISLQDDLKYPTYKGEYTRLTLTPGVLNLVFGNPSQMNWQSVLPSNTPAVGNTAISRRQFYSENFWVSKRLSKSLIASLKGFNKLREGTKKDTNGNSIYITNDSNYNIWHMSYPNAVIRGTSGFDGLTSADFGGDWSFAFINYREYDATIDRSITLYYTFVGYYRLADDEERYYGPLPETGVVGTGWDMKFWKSKTDAENFTRGKYVPNTYGNGRILSGAKVDATGNPIPSTDDPGSEYYTVTVPPQTVVWQADGIYAMSFGGSNIDSNMKSSIEIELDFSFEV